jgi:hypothetical protein
MRPGCGFIADARGSGRARDAHDLKGADGDAAAWRRVSIRAPVAGAEPNGIGSGPSPWENVADFHAAIVTICGA